MTYSAIFSCSCSGTLPRCQCTLRTVASKFPDATYIGAYSRRHQIRNFSNAHTGDLKDLTSSFTTRRGRFGFIVFYDESDTILGIYDCQKSQDLTEKYKTTHKL